MKKIITNTYVLVEVCIDGSVQDRELFYIKNEDKCLEFYDKLMGKIQKINQPRERGVNKGRNV